ncbi:MAG: hypothetical protein ACI4JB_04830, partial [Porcipelethomonas sp.]
MKKTKLVSVLTSFAMIGSMLSGTFSGILPVTAVTSDCPVGLEMVSDKTTYTLDEIKAGASATVYVDTSTTFTEDDLVASISFRLKPNKWGYVDPMNLRFCFPNRLSTNGGAASGNYNSSATLTLSDWTGDVQRPDESEYHAYGIKDDDPTVQYSDDIMPYASLVSDSTKGYIRTEDQYSKNHIAAFDIYFPTDLAAG